jgi:hypothetical protein
MNTVSLCRRLESCHEKNVHNDAINGQTQLGIDGKLLWVERYATPQGWMVMLSPSALAFFRRDVVKLKDSVEMQRDKDMYWEAYRMRCQLSLERRKLTWSPEERISCMTEQDVYEAHLITSLLQDESVRVRILAKAPAVHQAIFTPKAPAVHQGIFTPKAPAIHQAIFTPKVPAVHQGIFTPKVPTLTFFQQRILHMVSWVETIITKHGTAGNPPLSAVGVVCILYRLVEYTNELNALPSWEETDGITGRIRACVQTLYSILRTRFEHVIGGSLSMTAMDLQDPVEMVKTLLFDKVYTRTVVMDFSWLLFAHREIPRASDYLIHTAIHSVLWWRKELDTYLMRYTHTMIHHTTPVENDNYCLLKLLLESVRADDKITLQDAA